MLWARLNKTEQETIINIDYYEKVFTIYTSREFVYKKISKKIGKPDFCEYLNNKVCCVGWKIAFDDRKKIKGTLSINNLLMQYISTAKIE